MKSSSARRRATLPWLVLVSSCAALAAACADDEALTARAAAGGSGAGVAEPGGPLGPSTSSDGGSGSAPNGEGGPPSSSIDGGPSGPIATVPAPASPPAAYRTSHPNLFVDVAATTTTVAAGTLYEVPAKASTGAPADTYTIATVGPNYAYVDAAAQWAWQHPGGDFVNQKGAVQATTDPHFEIVANQVTAGAATYVVNATAGAQAAFARSKWNAYIVLGTGGPRAIASAHHPSQPGPRMDVTYTDGSKATLPARAVVPLVPGSAYTRVGAHEATLDGPVALEFEMPTMTVTSATVTMVVTQHTGAAATLRGYLASPPVNAEPVSVGVAATHPRDSGLKNEPSILFAQRYEDGTALSDYILPPTSIDVWNLSYWDPELFGTGPADPTKLPTAHQGTPVAGTHKWFYKQSAPGTVSLVASSYKGDGFAAPEPGLGALRIVIPRDPGADGASVGYGGSTGSDLWALFPKSIAGLVDETFVRFRVRFAVTPKALAVTKAFRTEAGAAATYAIREGKWGVGTHHWTFFGGNNNVGGDNLGHTNRLGFRVHPSDVGLMGIQSYVHSWDMIKEDMAFGAGGGLGASFQPNRWYWIEIRKKLNTYDPNGAVGSSPADGVMEIYVDGRLAARHTGWKYRDGRLDYAGETPIAKGKLVPFRQMGDMGLLLNMYNGGVKAADEDTVMFFAEVACGTRYIGMAP